MNISLRDRQSCVKAQLDRPTCVAFSVTAFHEQLLQAKNGNAQPEMLDLSEEFLYFFCKKHDGLSAGCKGTTIAAASLVLAKYGQCSEQLHPYRDEEPTPDSATPSQVALADAITRVHSGLRSSPMYSMTIEKSLRAGQPLVAVMDWFSNSYLAPHGNIGMPTSADRYLGRHAILIVGMNDESLTGCQIGFRNSWGTKWGDGGFGAFELDYLERYCRELWC